ALGSPPLTRPERSDSIGSSYGEPNQACPPLARSMTLVDGSSWSAPPQPVSKMFQPPSAGGFFDARRVTTVPQSAATYSTLRSSFFNRSVSTSASAWISGWSTASIKTIFSPLYPPWAISFFAASKSRLPVSTSEPALFAIGVPQVKTDGQISQFSGSPT